jgi:hypothetical protein
MQRGASFTGSIAPADFFERMQMKTLFAVFFMVITPIHAFGAMACRAGTATQIQGSDTTFVKTTFTPTCSVNVEVHYLQDQSNFAVQAASARGKTVFGGTTNTTGSAEIICSTVSSGSPIVVAPTAPNNPC